MESLFVHCETIWKHIKQLKKLSQYETLTLLVYHLTTLVSSQFYLRINVYATIGGIGFL